MGYMVKDMVDESALEGYGGWDKYALPTLGVPVALLIGYLGRHSLKYLIMVATALAGAVVSFKSLETMLLCNEVDLENVQALSTQIVIVIAVAVVGFFHPSP